MPTAPNRVTFRNGPPSYALNLTPCGESFFERDSVVSTSSKSGHKENNSPHSESCGRQSYLKCVLQTTKGPSSTVTPVSGASGSMVDLTSKDSLILTELLDSSDDEWTSTSAFGSNNGKMTSPSMGLGFSGSKFSSVQPTTRNQQKIADLSFQGQSTVPSKKCNSLISNFSPQRINAIPNSGNDGK